jgi:hypothetical protein
MVCAECQSDNLREFGTEMMIHHAGFPNGRADVFIFPMSRVCLGYGFSTFRVPAIALQALRDGDIEASPLRRIEHPGEVSRDFSSIFAQEGFRI